MKYTIKLAILLTVVWGLNGCGEESEESRHGLDVEKQIEIQEALDKKDTPKEETADIDTSHVNAQQETLTTKDTKRVENIVAADIVEETYRRGME